MPLIRMRDPYSTSLCTVHDEKNDDLGQEGLPHLTISLWGLANHHEKAAPEFLP
jgi:hypothetical protein